MAVVRSKSQWMRARSEERGERRERHHEFLDADKKDDGATWVSLTHAVVVQSGRNLPLQTLGVRLSSPLLLTLLLHHRHWCRGRRLCGQLARGPRLGGPHSQEESVRIPRTNTATKTIANAPNGRILRRAATSAHASAWQTRRFLAIALTAPRSCSLELFAKFSGRGYPS